MSKKDDIYEKIKRDSIAQRVKRLDDLETSKLKQTIGMCHDCSNLCYTRTEFDNILAYCDREGFASRMALRLTGQNIVTECTLYYNKNHMSLYDMTSIATLIDIDLKPIKGFTGRGDK